MSISITEKPNPIATVAGIGTGLTVSKALGKYSNKVASSWMTKSAQIAKTVDSVEISSNLEQALEVSGLKDKGVKILDLKGRTPKSAKEIDAKFKQTMFELLSKPGQKFKKIFEEYFSLGNRLLVEDIKAGGNAAFFANKNRILINTQEFGAVGFHELGHAMNYHGSKFLRFLQKARLPLAFVPAAFVWTALFKNPKVEGEKPEGVVDKTTTFIKNNVGKLTAMSMLPIISEEAIATIKGAKIAKQICSPEVFKKVVKCSSLGGATYVLGAIATGLGAFAANWVRDKIAHPKVIKE